MVQHERSRAVLLARGLVGLLLVYSGLRAAFFVLHADLFAAQSAGAVGEAFVRGLRFDLSAIAFSNIPVILLALVPGALFHRPMYQRILKGVFVAVNGFFVCVMVADLEYFTFTGTRATFDLLLLTSEATAQLDQLLVAYTPLALLAAALIVALFRLYPTAGSGPGSFLSGTAGRPRPSLGPRAASGVVFLRAGLLRLLLLVAVVVAARGGLQKKVLQPLHAFGHGQQELGILALNSTFTLLQSPLQAELEPLTYFPDDAQAGAILRAPFGYVSVESATDSRDPVSPPGSRESGSTVAEGNPAAPNVVLLILESFATEFWGAANEGKGFTPFLDSLARDGLFFSNNFANGRRSIDALPSLLLGVPSLASTSVAQSSFQGNQWKGLGHLLGDAGYHSSFFHGAPRGTMYFDAIAGMAGVQEFHPLERYPEDLQEVDFDGHWGLYDGPFLQYAAREMGRQPQPFFSTVFTISTHQPYRVPPAFDTLIPPGELDIHQSVRYVDMALEAFFGTVRDEPWYANTVFIITGDHTQNSRSLDHDSFLGRFMVPLLLYAPALEFPAVDDGRITQHVDVFHTILDVAGVEPGPIPLFGRSVFSAAPGEAVLQSNGLFWLVREEGVVQRDPGGEEHLFAFRRHRTEAKAVDAPQVREKLGRRLQAHLQHFNNSLLFNSFYRNPGQTTGRRAGGTGPSMGGA